MERKSEWLDELLAKTDIVKLISAYVPLKRKGATYWGCCPFHHEKTPSFSVNEQKQLYHCFGCGAGGNAITFVKNIESVDSSQAVKILAKAAGMELPKENFFKDADPNLIKKRERLYALMREAARRYHANLSDPRAKAAVEYLTRRGLDRSTVTKFGLGYSLDGRDVIEHLKKLGYTESEMKEAGIAENGERGYYDVFYDRVIYPIINGFGEVVAFGGRTLKPDPGFAKYRNSSQTLIFDKSKTIYGINLLKKRKLKAPIEYIIMAEGYMDVISLHKAGFDTAVASMGTALTFNQAKQIRNYCDRVYISYDGDTAGQKATMRGLDILVQAGLNVKVVSLPDGLDPDDFIKKYGAEGYEKLLGKAKSLPAFKIDKLKESYDLELPEEKSKFAVEAIRVVKELENPVEREEYLSLVHAYTNYPMDVLRRQADITPAAAYRPPEPAPADRNAGAKKADTKDEKAALFVLACLAEDMDFVDWTEDFVSLLTDEFYSTVADLLVSAKREGRKNTGLLYDRIDEKYHGKLGTILSYNFMVGDDKEKYNDCMNVLKISAVKREIERLNAKYKEKKDIGIISEIAKLDEKLKTLKNGGDSNE